MRRLGVLAFLIAAVFMVAVPSGSANAAEAVGCSGEATSFTASGVLLDGATGPGEGGSADRPFVIDMDGKVSWSGSTDAVITNGSWSVNVAGLPVDNGEFTNDDRLQSNSGDFALSELPDLVSAMLGALGEAKIPVSATVTGDGGSCTASGYVTGKGSPYASPLFYSAIFFLLIGLLLLLWMLAITL